MGSYAIVVKDLVKRFGDIVAVNGISFEVRWGEVFGLLGPNGAGKTTTVHILTTLLRPTSGDAWVAGHHVVEEASAVRKCIGVVFQDPSLDPELSAYENLYIHGAVYGLRGEELRYRVEEALRFVELYEHRHRLVKHFSWGMRRRLEIARALLHKPRVLFMDEPTIGLDPYSRILVWSYIEKLRKEGVTVFLTTHYMEEAERLCNRIAVMDRGKIVAIGSPDELKKLVSSDIIYLRVEPASARQAICEVLDVPSVSECRVLSGGMVMLRVDDATRAIPMILEKAARSGLSVAEVSYRRPTLNDVFLYLTGRPLSGGIEDFAKQLLAKLLRRVGR